MNRYETSEKLGCARAIIAAVNVVASIAGLIATCSADTSGKGNEFEFKGIVAEVTTEAQNCAL